MTDRSKIAARIRALLTKTVANGCTEDEAIAAAEMASRLLEKYKLTVDEVEMRENPFAQHAEAHSDLVGDRLWKVASAIADLTECEFWVSSAGIYPVEMNFFGFDHEVEISKYLLAICRNAMTTEHDRLKKEVGLYRPERQRRKILPFLDGMADSLARRIRALKPDKVTGTGLIVLKKQLIEAEMKLREIDLKNRRMRGSRNLEDEYTQGYLAGERVSLNRGIHQETKTNPRLLH